MKTKMLRKTIAAIMALTIIGGAMPTGFTETILSERAITADAATGSVTLSGDTLILNGEISKQQLYTFKGNENIKNIVAMHGTILPEDSSFLFCDFKKVLSINLLNADTSNVTNMMNMFDNCVYLASLDLSGFDTSNTTDMSCMFRDCHSLEHIDLSSFNTSNVTDMSGMFQSCYRLTSLDVSYFNTSNVKDMFSMFSGCDSLTKLDLSNFDTSNVERMGSMFNGCDKLSNINTSSFDTTNVNNMDYMFACCGCLTILDLSNFDTSNVERMEGMFWGSYALTKLNLRNFNTSKVKTMRTMFAYCDSLEYIDIKGFNTSNVTDMRDMFYGCTSLKQVIVSSDLNLNEHFAYGVLNPEYMLINDLSSYNVRFSHDVILKNNFSINYYTPVYMLEGFSNIKLKIQEEVVNADGTTSLEDRTTLSSETETFGYGTQYVFRYNNIPAKKIGSNFHATLYAEKDGIKHCAEVTDVYSIKKYANAKINKSTTSTAMKELLINMLNFGAAAQLYTNYNTTNLANSELTATQQDYITKFNSMTLKSDYSVKKLTGAKAKIKKANLLIDDNVSIRYYTTFDDTVNKNNVKLCLTYKNINGKTITKNVAFNSQNFTFDSDTGAYMYKFSDLDAKNAYQPVTATLYENGTQISDKVTYSIQTYVYDNYKKEKLDLVLRNVMKAMIVYFNTAKNYTAWNSNSGLNT